MKQKKETDHKGNKGNRGTVGSWFNVNRIGAISDGVFAIAMTLLVLDLKLPELEAPVSSDLFSAAILAQLPHFFSWIISFAILCRLWLIQHPLVEGVDTKSRGFTNLNFVFLGAVSFIAFPTSLISEHPDQALSVFIFSATQLVANLSLGGMWFLSQGERSRDDTEAEKRRRVIHSIIYMIIICLLSCLLALVKPQLGIAVWVAVLFAGFTQRRKKRYKTPQA